MVKIILVRHGETEWNRQEIFRGQLDVPLNKNGLRQAQAVARALKKIPIDAVYTSPLRRARDTARAIAQSQGLIVRSNRAFIDINFGQWQGQIHEVIKQQYKQLYSQWQQQPHKVRFPKGESLQSVRQRAMRILIALCQRHQEDNVLIIAHRVVNKVILCAVLGLDNSHFWKIKQETGAINIFNYTGKVFDIELINDTCHLKGLPHQTLDF